MPLPVSAFDCPPIDPLASPLSPAAKPAGEAAASDFVGSSALSAWAGLSPRPIPESWREKMPPEALAALRRFVEEGEHAAIEPWFDLRLGFEIHLRLATGRKLFCGESADEAGYVDLGLPGSYPELDPEAARLARRMGRALGARIPERMAFERKRYAYPDLTKGYQTTQKGLCAFHGGRLASVAGELRFERGQIEEDAASARRIGPRFEIDCGRAGSPLIEIVTEPLRMDPALAGAACRAARDLAVHLGVSGGAPEKAEFKTDVCVSIAPLGLPWGERVEIKGVALFESVERAAVSGAKMLAELLLAGGQPSASTFRHDEDTGELTPMREKQDALYRFLPDGDLGMVPAEPLDAHEALWDALPAPGEWRARSLASRGPMLDDPAAESLCWLAAATLGRLAAIEAWRPELSGDARVMQAEPTTGMASAASDWIAKIEKTALSALSRLRASTPREPRPRVALAEAIAWSVLAQEAGAPARAALDIALATLKKQEESKPATASRDAGFDTLAADHALAQAMAALDPARSQELAAIIEPWLAAEPAAASWRELLSGKQKAIGSLIGLARRQWPQEDPQRLGEALRELAKRAAG
jgi:Asp-tRNA(Asn)/Glu-tRNA(Gln) amidotransferase B subunit